MRAWLRAQFVLFLIWLSFLGAAIDQTMVSNLLNATLPTGSGGIPGSFTALSASAMKLKLTSTASTAAASGTELTGTGYTTGGTAITTGSTASSAGSSVSLPNMSSGISWVNGSGGNWSIQSLEIINNASTVRSWFGNWNGAPVVIANGNTFLVAQNAVSVSLS